MTGTKQFQRCFARPVAFRLASASIPKLYGSAAILAFWDRSLEISVVEVTGLIGDPFASLKSARLFPPPARVCLDELRGSGTTLYLSGGQTIGVDATAMMVRNAMKQAVTAPGEDIEIKTSK